MLQNIAIALKDLPVSESPLVRKSMTAISRRYSTSPALRARSSSRSLANVTGPDGHLLPGKLSLIACILT